MVRVINRGQFASGIFFVFATVYPVVLGYYPISFVNIYFLLAGIFLIFNSILESKITILHMLFGFILLISVFIWIIIQNAPSLSKEILMGIITGIIFLILGIIGHLGYLSEE